jgi:hypothetical protein
MSIENETRAILGFAHPVEMSPTAKLRLPGHPEILATPPAGESRYGKKRGKKKRLSEERQWGKCVGRGFRGGWRGGARVGGGGCTCVRACVRAGTRACVHAPFDLPPIAKRQLRTTTYATTPTRALAHTHADTRRARQVVSKSHAKLLLRAQSGLRVVINSTR